MHPNYNSDPNQAPQGGAHGYQQSAPPLAATYGNKHRPSQWTTGLCGCLEDPCSCMKTCFCPCITLGQNAEIIDKGTTSCCCACLIYYALVYAGCSYSLYSSSFRSKLRGLYGLPKEPCADGCVHWLLPCCAISQEYRELKNRGLDPSIGWIANARKMNQGGNPAPPHVAPGMYR